MKKVERVLKDKVALRDYDSHWPQLFLEEKEHLLNCIPKGLIKRIEHFGSTAVPGLAAKPIVDMLVEVTSLKETKELVPPILESQGYDYFWRPTWGDNTPPFYAWFIKRHSNGKRSHHIHMVEKDFEHWDRLLFRDYLIAHPNTARAYNLLKQDLVNKHPDDRIAYTQGKTEFIIEITKRAKAQVSDEPEA